MDPPSVRDKAARLEDLRNTESSASPMAGAVSLSSHPAEATVGDAGYEGGACRVAKGNKPIWTNVTFPKLLKLQLFGDSGGRSNGAILKSWSFPMIRSSNKTRSRACRALKHLGVPTAVLCACMPQHLVAQRQLTGSLGSQLFSRSATSSRSAAGLFAPADAPVSNIGAGEVSASPGAVAMFRLGSKPAGGFDAFRSAPIRSAWKSEESDLPLAPALKRVLGESANERSLPTLFSLATLNRSMRRDLYLPLGPCLGGLRFDFEDNPRPGSKPPGMSSGSASAMFTSSTLRNGVTFSAGAMFGARPTLFPPAGSHGLAAQRGAVPSLALKFSF